MKKISFAILCMLMLSCKDEDPISEFKKCNFSSNTKTLTLSNKQGVLNYSRSIEGIAVSDYIYYIKTEGQLPMTVCNMPESMKIEKDSKVSVIFSGKVEVLDNRTDAISTRIELTDLKL
ncbi:hypothetical protein ACFX5U_12570 [Sphingobacterium sp. SG20118]|uniref:hypothetical protein n=1 Tax=Sphingobacterium sp. SG20118 TaxID=3367156 RepID=UPI0037DFC795